MTRGESMSEYTEMVLDGTLCQVCGQLVNEKPVGYPVTCEDCGGNSA